MDYSMIINQIYNLILNNNFLAFAGVGIILLLLLFIISKTFRKSGLFLLALTFLVDFIIRSLPFNVYEAYPLARNIVNGFYGLGIINFFVRVIWMIIKSSKNNKEEVKDSNVRRFLKFTGIRPFLFMILINIANYNNVLPKNIINLLTSLSFLYMAFRTLYSTYIFLSNREKIVIDDGMDFKEIDAYLADEGPYKNRKIKKKLDDDIKIFTDEEKKSYTNPIFISDIKKDMENKEKIKNIEKDLSNTDMINLIESGKANNTSIKITNLNTKEEKSYTSNKASFKLVDADEYKIDLEFENINDYDYGRFIDLLLIYSRHKEDYKFELVISPSDRSDFKLVFFDPSEIFDIKDEKLSNIGGKVISMNFPKYKINFVKDNY